MMVKMCCVKQWKIYSKAIIERKKQGFSAPDESWYRGENAKYIKELLLERTLLVLNI